LTYWIGAKNNTITRNKHEKTPVRPANSLGAVHKRRPHPQLARTGLATFRQNVWGFRYLFVCDVTTPRKWQSTSDTV